MKGLYKFLLAVMLLFFLTSHLQVISAFALSDKPTFAITEWEMMWEDKTDSRVQDAISRNDIDWMKVEYGNPYPQVPKGIHTAWIRFKLPKLDWSAPALSVNKLYATNVHIYIQEMNVFANIREYSYDKNQFLLPLDRQTSLSTVYMKIDTDTDRLGIQDQLVVGEFQFLAKNYMIRDLIDVILGASLVFISMSILLCMLFIKKTYMKGWGSLSSVILSVGLMILTYSPFVHTNFSQYGKISYYLFDMASTLLMPSLFFFIEKIFGRGPYGFILRFRNLQVFIAVVCIIWLLISFKWEAAYEWYVYAATVSFALSIIIGNLLFIGSLVVFCRKGNKDAIIMSTGLSIFAAVSGAEIIWFFTTGMMHQMFYWKWGIFGFFASLVIILARRISNNYEQVLRYSKQLEIFNNELQRSEKMEMISQLAASIAHEVRNPLQVTRGFLQLLGSKASNDKDKNYMVIAIDELDRASEIITDFLTFAKPQLEHTTLLNIGEELQKIEGILVPLATMQGGVIHLKIAADLYVRGNSSKFKQALINIIKNSIEALGENGVIEIQAFENKDDNHVVIRIQDNGEGMNESDIKRLGEPYYSKKSKGTGLGLMVTYRIIESMQGSIVYKSIKGNGTEANIFLPVSIQ